MQCKEDPNLEFGIKIFDILAYLLLDILKSCRHFILTDYQETESDLSWLLNYFD